MPRKATLEPVVPKVEPLDITPWAFANIIFAYLVISRLLRKLGDGDNFTTVKSEYTAVRNKAARCEPPKLPSLLDHICLCLPAACVQQAGLEPNLNDKGAVKDLWFGRVWQYRVLRKEIHHRVEMAEALTWSQRRDLDRTVSEIKNDPVKRMQFKHLAAHWKRAAYKRRNSLAFLEIFDSVTCNVRGIVVYAHGSGGLTYNNLRFCRMLAAEGYIVIAPDDMAGAFKADESDFMDSRHRSLRELILPEEDADYWADDLVYSGSSEGRLAYSTKATAVLSDPVAYRKLYEEVFQLRSGEMHYVLGKLPVFAKRLGVFTMGTSEGAMTVARLDDSKYASFLSGRIISAFGIEHCYFTPTKEAAKIGGALSVPTLQIIGDEDEYFGKTGSVAAEVAKDKASGFFNPDLNGHAHTTLTTQKVEKGLVCVMEGGRHDATVTHDNFFRVVLQTFLAKPSHCFQLDELWQDDPFLMSMVAKVSHKPSPSAASKVLLVNIGNPRRPQDLTVRQSEAYALMHGAGKTAGPKMAGLAHKAFGSLFSSKDMEAAERKQAAREAEAKKAADAALASFKSQSKVLAPPPSTDKPAGKLATAVVKTPSEVIKPNGKP